MVLCCKLTHNRSQIRRPAWTEAPAAVLPLMGVVLVVLGLVLRGEMKTDEALPSIGAVPWTGEGKVRVIVKQAPRRAP